MERTNLDSDTLRWLLGGLAALWMASIGWLWRQIHELKKGNDAQDERISNLEKHYEGRLATVEQAVKGVEKNQTQLHVDMQQGFRTVNQNILNNRS